MLCRERAEPLSKAFHFCGYMLSYSANTDCSNFSSGQVSVAIIGLCVDSHGEIERSAIPEYLAKKMKDGGGGEAGVLNAIEHCDRLAGSYLILFGDSSGVFALTDAISSVQANYYEVEGCVASSENLVAQKYGLPISKRNREIRQASSFSEAMPYDVTLYDHIRTLLPNHYLKVDSGSAVRFFPSVARIKPDATLDKVVETSIGLVDNIVREYLKHEDCICPLTAGWDSRVVLAFMRRNRSAITCYTAIHDSLGEGSDDIKIPRQITADLGIAYRVIPPARAPQEWVNFVRDYVGPFHSRFMIDSAFQFRKSFKGRAVVNGQIIDQIGKSKTGINLPDFFASDGFLRCRLHNYSRLASSEIKRWRKAIPASWVSRFDLFAWESRLGRWSSQNNTVCAALSMRSLNIFNCREIILLWLSVSRSKRAKLMLHKAILGKVDPILLKYPVNPSNRVAFLKKSRLLFFLGTYIKYYFGAIRAAISLEDQSRP